MNQKKVNILNKQGSKQFNILNMKPFIKLSKKQHKLSSRLNYVYGLEYKKRLYRQNLVNNLAYNSFKKNETKLFANKCNFFHINNNIIPFCSITKYSAFLNNSNVWPIQKQTTALKVYPQSSTFWSYSLDKLDLISTDTVNQSLTTPINNNKKNKRWTAGFVRVRKLRQYYSKQLQNRNKLLYWLGYPSFGNLRKILNKIYRHNHSKFITWSIIKFLDSLWSNVIVKTNFVFNSSASPNIIKQKKGRYNGFIMHRAYGFCQPGDIVYKQ